MSTPLIDALERRSERGARRDPAAVIANARSHADGRTLLAGEHAEDRLVLPSIGVEAAWTDPTQRSPARRRPVVLAIAAAVTMLLGIGALALHAGRRPDGGVGGAATSPQGPLALSDEARKAAVDRCLDEWVPTTTIVDHRPGGLFVGLVHKDVYKGCVVPDGGSVPSPTSLTMVSSMALDSEPDTPIDVFVASIGRIVTASPTEQWVWGRIRPAVAHVVVATSSGNFVATVEHGLYAAWWMGRSDDRAAVHAYDRFGRELVVIDELECSKTPRVSRAGGDTTGGCAEGRPADDLPAAPPPTPEPPSTITADERAAAVGACHDQDVARAASSGPVVADVVDARVAGRFAAGVTGSSWFFCLDPTTPGAVVGSRQSMGNAGVGLLPTASPTEPLAVIDAKSPDGNMIDGNEATWVWGWVDPGVASVVVSAPSGTFQTTIEHGLFAAWWPGNDGDRTVVRALDAEGREIAFVDQLSCGDGSGIHPRLVVGGAYVSGGCPAGHDLPPGVGADGIPDPPAPSGS